MSNRLEEIQKKIDVLKNRKQKIVTREKQKERKLLTKQKILLGGYLYSLMKKKPVIEVAKILDDIQKTIHENRKSDNKAIEELRQHFGIEKNDYANINTEQTEK
jgi:hypothetical protein